MSVKINLGEWGSVFAVPSSIVDKHLKLASQNQLKVLLFLLRNSDKSFTYKEIGDNLRIHEEDVRDCVDFWVERKVFSNDGGELSPEGEKNPENSSEPKRSESEPKRKTVVSRPLKPDIITASQRVSQDEKLGHVLSEAELALGKPLSGGNVATLVMLYDTCGLPAEVLVMLVNYCVGVGKGNMRAIERVGLSWADSGVNSVEAADSIIMQSRQSDMNWSRVSSVFGLKNIGSPTSKQLEFADRWISSWRFSDDMLRRAYEICVDTKGEMKLSYINGILDRWQKSGIFTIDAIEKKDVKKPKKQANNSDASYDIEALMKID